MNRRAVIRQLVIVSGGIMLLPACSNPNEPSTIRLKNFSLDGNHEELVASLSEAIIPATDTPGARELSTHLFVFKMMDDCYDKETQQAFVKGLDSFREQCKKKYGKNFQDCSEAQKNEWLTYIESKKDVPEEIQKTYGLVKNLTIQGYMNSKYVMTNITHYELIPGKFDGCFPVNA